MRKLIFLFLAVGLFSWWYKDSTITASDSDISYSYVVRYAGEASSRDELPMLVALHGNGDNPEHFYSTALDKLTEPARVILIKGPIAMGGGGAWPMDGGQVQEHAAALANVSGQLAEKYPTKGKPVLFGFSGGAVMAYYMAARHPADYAAVFPISGRLSQKTLINNTKAGASSTKVYAYHGNKDMVIAVGGGRNAVELLRSQGTAVDYTEFEGGHHGVFTGMKDEINREIGKSLRWAK